MKSIPSFTYLDFEYNIDQLDLPQIIENINNINARENKS